MVIYDWYDVIIAIYYSIYHLAIYLIIVTYHYNIMIADFISSK